MNLFDTPTDAAIAKFDGAVRGRPISWEAFYKIRPDLRPANDDQDDRDVRFGGGVRSATGACSASTSATARPYR
ncbi:hypothetical protein EN851_03435 [Mesorhizobium sp. M8A.F.Ca.ET.208.01.1.1]|uniref:hypothetical protein n=1 Tax=unclassified Mesorhizobium TaxID=325217 RepID=UPI0010936033|nr:MULTISPECIES: hypothetical protein [unclassified Mesorhizobium]TGQ94621.1 hypothetical protein EN851_03435 [Mesorhizobium sp. M8A.F.Ca.ET.208.01.1.1]TGT55109.1 hypothetical protein EN810_03435 [Mesorhizobium sp. M8A.F.Ca.ET.167.01.1.1]